jgi:hypothetical protein
MDHQDTNNTKFCVSKATFEFLDTPRELVAAKHDRIMRIFQGALLRQIKESRRAARG